MIREMDLALVQWLNGFVGHSALFDRVMLATLDIELVKNVPLVAGLWWIWFSGHDEPSRSKARFTAFAGTLGVLAGCLLSRALQNLGPEHPRPLFTPGLELRPLEGLPEKVMADFSSFPSDTATLSFSLATVIWLHSRRWGILAYLWALLAISLPRVYVGYHFPMDILGGALLGTALVHLAVRSPLRRPIAFAFQKLLQPFEARHAGAFYAGLFLVTYQIGSVFDELRHLGRSFTTFLKLYG